MDLGPERASGVGRPVLGGRVDHEHLVDEVADARDRPDEVVASTAFADLMDYLDPELFPPDDVQRWKSLRQIRDERAVGVYLSDI
jgi:hypothetical protein